MKAKNYTEKGTKKLKERLTVEGVEDCTCSKDDAQPLHISVTIDVQKT